jgi:photosystem II stability/assembly factor-like uncharacterized protein
MCAAGGAASASGLDPALYGGMQWRLLGPFRGGWATVVDGVASKPDTFYFGGAGGGVWRTDDSGRTWQALFQKGPAASIGALTVAPSNPNVIYVGTGQPEPRYDIEAGRGVFKSTDGGAHWSPLGLAETRYIGRIWVDPANAENVLVGAQGRFFGPSPDRGIYRSTDGGKNWSHVLKINDWTGVVDIASDPKNPKLLFASAWEAHQYPWLSYFVPVTGPGSAIYKSTDGGASWQKLSGGGWPASALGRIGLAVSHTSKGARIYAAIDLKQSGGLWRSDDSGAHWTRVNDSDAIDSWYASRLTVAPNDPDVVYTVGQSIRRCDHGGSHCVIIKGAPGGDDYHHIWINPLHPDHMITGSDQGAVVTVNGGQTWSSWYNQPTGQFYHLAADNRFPYWLYSGQQDSGSVGIASRSDFGQLTFRDWNPVGADERDYDIPDPNDPMIVYGSGLGGHVSKFDARTGQVGDITPWPESNYGKRPTLVKYHYMWTTPLVGSSVGPATLYLGAQVLFRSRDRGASWQVISPDLTGKSPNATDCNSDVDLEQAKTCGFGSIAAIAPSPRHAEEIWVGSDDGLIQLTRDGGAHWANVTPPAIPLWAKVQNIDVSALQDGVAYAAVDAHRIDDFAPHILVTRDNGKTWSAAVSGLPGDHFVSVVRADPVKQGLLYAGTDAGAYVSFDDGENWSNLQENLPTTWVTDLLVHDNDLIAATQGRAIWALDDVNPLREISATLPTQSAHLFAPARALRVRWNNNHDTPLPPETPVGENPPEGAVIDYWLGPATKGAVTLEIHDDKGALVRQFSSEEKPEQLKADRYFAKSWVVPQQMLSGAPGMHRFAWNLRYPRPDAIGYDYSIAAVWKHSSPLSPQGAIALPGDYTITLTANGVKYNAPLTISEDPRIHISESDLAASLALSEKIASALRETKNGYREQKAIRKLLDARFPKTGKINPALLALCEPLRAKPAPGQPTFESVDGMLTEMESALEAADAAPTAAQQSFVDDALSKLAPLQRDWAAAKSGALAKLNAALSQAGQAPIIVTPAELNEVEEPDSGQDLP